MMMRPSALLFLSCCLALLPPNARAGISTGYVPPNGKQGVGDPYYTDYTNANLTSRYARFTQLGLSTKVYNLFWSALETSAQASSASPVACPAGHMLVPANESERTAKGYKRYRCINQATVSSFDNLFTRDSQAGLQTAVVLWSAPERYRYSACVGTPTGPTTVMRDGCVPRDDVMDDWEDYINFLADRYDGGEGHGKISHFIVWNENASGIWFDYSPIVPTRAQTLTEAQRQAWVDKYVGMLQRTHSALARNTSGVLMVVSTDPPWEPPPFGGTHHIGTRTLLSGIWAQLGTSVDWSVAVHPYEDPVEAAADYINFQNVSTLSEFQRTQLMARGVANPLAAPQSRILATEQGWKKREGIDVQARIVCEAHALTMRNPALLTQTHIWFQDTTPDGQSLDSTGLVPWEAGLDLSLADGMATFEAFRSTGPATWGKGDTHFCCQQHGLGCTSARPLPLSSATSNNALWSAAALKDGNTGTLYSSNEFTSWMNTDWTYVELQLPAGRAAGGWMVGTVKLHARLWNGAPTAFPKRYRINVRNAANTGWLFVGEFDAQPDSSGAATVALPRMYRTTGVQVIPTIIGQDPNGRYYFQLAEAELLPSLAYQSAQPYVFTSHTSNDVLAGWPVSFLADHDAATAYSSGFFTTSANTRNTFVAAWLPAQSTVTGIRLRARMLNGAVQAFPRRYRLYVTNPANTQWTDLGEYEQQPDATGTVVVALPQARQTWGVYVTPTVLGQDANGSYLFQLAEVMLLP